MSEDEQKQKKVKVDCVLTHEADRAEYLLAEAKAANSKFRKSVDEEFVRVSKILRRFLPARAKTRDIKHSCTDSLSVCLPEGWWHVSHRAADDRATVDYEVDDYFYRSNEDNRTYAKKLEDRLNMPDAAVLKEPLRKLVAALVHPGMRSDWPKPK